MIKGEISALYYCINMYLDKNWCDPKFWVSCPEYPIQEFDLMILIGSFQLSILCDSMILYFIPQILISYTYGIEKLF